MSDNINHNWRAGKIILLTGVIILFPLFFIGGPSSHSPRSYMAFWNLGHPFFFMLLTLLLGSRLSEKLFWRRALLLCLLVIGVGTLIEIIQSGIVGRTASVSDVIRDFMGGVMGLAWIGWRYFSRKMRLTVIVIVGGILYWNISPLLTAAADEWQARRQFPLLAGFESPLELTRWTGNAGRRRVRTMARQGKFSLRIDLTTAVYSGVSLHYFPHDWRGFSSLRLSIFSGNAGLPVTVRINDRRHEEGKQRYTDRFNRSFTLNRGWNDIDISLSEVKNAPQGRQMEMADICGLGIFVIRQSEKKVIYLDDVRLR